MSISTQANRGNPRTRIFLLAGAVVALAATGRAALSMYNKYKVASAILEEKSVQYESLAERSEYLEGELAAISTPEGLEAEIRRKFSMAREGEEVIILVDPDRDKKKIRPLQHELSWFGKIWQSINPFD